MPYNRGDVVLVLFPNTNMTTAKRRPVLVIQADNLLSGLPQTILAMITSNMARGGHRSRVTILQNSPEGATAGILTDSIIMTDNLVTVLEKEIDRSIGLLKDMTLVDEALKHTLSLV